MKGFSLGPAYGEELVYGNMKQAGVVWVAEARAFSVARSQVHSSTYVC